MKDIIVNKLNVSYGDKKVLKDFSATFEYGKCTAIMGKSGCGKTTLLKALLGIVKPESGSIEGMPEKIGMVFQEDRLCEDFTALDNIKLVGDGKIVDLGVNLKMPVKELSGGQKRRVAIARAINYQPDLFILDEPFKGLDGASKEMVIKALKAENKTIILVTHDISEAEAMGASKIIKL